MKNSQNNYLLKKRLEVLKFAKIFISEKGLTKNSLENISKRYGIDINETELLFPEGNIDLIKLISNKMGISSSFKLASSFNIDSKRTDKIIEICILNHASEYISPIGAKEYLKEDGNFNKSKIKLSFFDYKPKIYDQINQKEFVSHLSIIDLIANIGLKQSKEYLLNNEN